MFQIWDGKVTPPNQKHFEKERLAFTKEHQSWLNEWNNIIWRDEAHFEGYNRKNRTFVRRLKSEFN